MRLNITKILTSIIILIGLFSPIATHAYFNVDQGGTGAGTLTGCLQGNGTAPVTGTGFACGSGGSGGSAALPYNSVQYSYQSGTSTQFGGNASFSFNSTTLTEFVKNFVASTSIVNNATTTNATSTNFFTQALSLGSTAISYIQSLFTQGTGIGISGGVISNTGVTSNIAGSGISVSGSTGAVTIGNTGVLSIGGLTGAVATSSLGLGTVTSVTCGTGLSGGTITSLGTCANAGVLSIGGLTGNVATSSLGFPSYAYGSSTYYLASNPNGYNSGTVTTLTAGSNITFSSGSTCTTTCTINSTAGGTGTITSVGVVVPTGLTVSGVPITTAGTATIAFTAGYNIPLTASTTQWASAYASTTALNASSPIIYNVSTGNFSCPSCITGSTTLLTTSQFFLDNGRNSATYPAGVASGTIQYPYTSLSQALQNIKNSGVGAATLYIAPANTYVETNDTWPNIPTTVYADKSTIITGGGSGTGTITFPNQFIWNGGTIIGNVNETDTATTSPHTFEDDNVILGNLTCSGLCTLLNGATNPSLGGATTTIYQNAGSLMNILGENVVSSIIDAGGTLNLNDDQVIANTSGYAIMSTTTGSSVEVLGLTLVNNGSGGGINVQNSATTVPNNLNNIIINENNGAIPIINNSSTATILNGYNAYSFTGTQQYAQGSGYIPSDNIGLQSDGTNNLGQNQGGIALGTTTIWNPLVASSSVTLSFITGTTSCLAVTATGTVFGTGTTCGSGGSSAVNSVSNSDGTLTISPTTGSVVASLALGHANSWTGGQTFLNATSTNLFATTTIFSTTTVNQAIKAKIYLYPDGSVLAQGSTFPTLNYPAGGGVLANFNGALDLPTTNNVMDSIGSAGNPGNVLMNSLSTGLPVWIATSSLGISGSGGSPASPTNSVQFNNSGSFGGSSNFIWDNTNAALNIDGGTSANGSLNIGSTATSTAALLYSGIASTTVYDQIYIQNTSSSGNASEDFVAGQAGGNATSSNWYGDYGCQNRGTTDPTFTGINAGDCYLYDTDGGLDFGTATTSASSTINFFTGGILKSTTRMTINSTGVGIGSTSPVNGLGIQGQSTLSSTTNILTVASSSAQAVMSVDGNGDTILGTSTAPIGLIFTATGNLGVGSSSPSDPLSLFTNSGVSGTLPIFNIASSTATNTSTTTLFSVLGNGGIVVRDSSATSTYSTCSLLRTYLGVLTVSTTTCI